MLTIIGWLLDFFLWDGRLWDSGGGAPGPTAEETALTKQQTQLLQEQSALLKKQAAAQDLLQPILLDQLGLNTIFSDVANPALAPLDKRIDDLNAQLARMPAMISNPTPFNGFNGNATVPNPNRQKLEQQIADIQAQRAALPQTIKQISGYEKRPQTPEELLAAQNQKKLQELTLSELERQSAAAPQNAEIAKLLRDRELAALKGELPIDPTLTRELGTSEATLRSSLQKQLGPGYETSTPGIEALANFMARKNELIYGANRGEITLGEQLGGARDAAAFGRGSTALTQAELSDRLRASNLGQIFNYGVPGRGIDYASLASAYQGPLSGLQQQRMLQNQLDAQGRSDWFKLIGTGVGVGLGMWGANGFPGIG